MKAIIPIVSIKGTFSPIARHNSPFARSTSLPPPPTAERRETNATFPPTLLPPPNKGFQNVLTCLDKVGDDITIEARQDRLILSTLSLTRTAYANFTFSRSFFESYSLDLSSPAIQYDDEGPFLRCTIIAKVITIDGCVPFGD